MKATGDRRLEGLVAVVTGAGRGIGRAHALALAQHGAQIVVNDYGGAMDGAGADATAGAGVVREIIDMGGKALSDAGDVGSWSDAQQLVERTLEHFGKLDILINNAGILRPKTLVGMTEYDVSSVLRVHLLGTFAMSHFAAQHWRERFKAQGLEGGRLINTTSAAGLYGAGQSNYAAAKAGIAALTMVAAEELRRYGATVNAVSPLALTRMSVGLVKDNFTPDHVAEFACWLASPGAVQVTGRVFNVGGGHVSIVDRWHTAASINRTDGWSMAELDEAMPGMLCKARPHPDATGYVIGEERPPELPIIDMPSGAPP